ncbi:tRNA 2-selenouridine(34) synthase MnmH [Sinisalibacter aestuarii]|uniref:tRNA 2-selenouridine synthase n=1 Tax=Sinisalibacter aestuarii TaxID=2949426 RepID=A0ABQ5LWP3_9RHOB|nr:tRNA 2-selenouridine(34) synthase MnmH [Sinisalibacter aestuarii]GKY89378.1 tRNA 2-selenouridine synthase [Sinisalibacter aestuarii]
MPITLTALTDFATLPFDEVIDVRSPSEFAEDRMPGAISLPVLSDEERARVGTIYVQQEPFLARKIGAALVAQNAARHLQGPLADRDGGWRPLVYCWRGGQRSGSFAAILREIGWRVDTVKGGYKAYRALVVDALYRAPLAPRVVIVDGGTGTAKTRLLHEIAAQGGQVVDLEAMAEHRGSVFGPMGEAQPDQKAFESRLAMALAGLDPARPVFVEAESSKIGGLIVPPSLWKQMITAARVEVAAPLAARAAHLVAEYPDMVADPARLGAVLDKLVRYHGHARVDAWRAQAAAGEFAPMAAELIAEHYDPRYRRISRDEAPRLLTLDLPDLTGQTLAQAAAEIIRKAG